jgi:hypothetical protein
MKTLNDYLMESAKTYEFRLKTCCELSDDQLDSLEKHMRKYEAFDIESPKRTILQSAPLDFHNVGATEIYIMDFKTKLPMSPAMLVNELVQKIGISERDIRVRNKLEPAEQEDAASMEEPTDGETDALLLDGEYTEAENHKAEDHYGDQYNTKFVAELERTRKEHNTEYKGKSNGS